MSFLGCFHLHPDIDHTHSPVSLFCFFPASDDALPLPNSASPSTSVLCAHSKEVHRGSLQEQGFDTVAWMLYQWSHHWRKSCSLPPVISCIKMLRDVSGPTCPFSQHDGELTGSILSRKSQLVWVWECNSCAMPWSQHSVLLSLPSALRFFLVLLQHSLILAEGDIDFPFMATCSIVINSQDFDQLWVSAASSLWSDTGSSGFWPGLGYHSGIPSHGAGPKSNHKAVGYPPWQSLHYCIREQYVVPG